MVNEQTKQIADIVLLGILGTLMFILFILGINFLSIHVSDDVNNINYALMLQNHVGENNLSLPYPSFRQEFSGFDKRFIHKQRKQIMEKNISEFTKIVEKNYEYEKGTYDCKYWSFVWTNYWKFHKEEYNWDMKYITTDNHIFVMVYNSTSYCTFDENNVNCYSGNFNNFQI